MMTAASNSRIVLSGWAPGGGIMMDHPRDASVPWDTRRNQICCKHAAPAMSHHALLLQPCPAASSWGQAMQGPAVPLKSPIGRAAHVDGII